MIEVSNVPVSLDAALPEHGDMLRREVARALGVKLRAVGSVVALKRSVDARKKSNVHFVMTCAVELSDGCEPRPVRGVSVKDHAPRASLAVPDASAVFAASGEPRPVVVGAGPAGLFAALYLARAGMRPIVVERGAAVDERVAAVAQKIADELDLPLEFEDERLSSQEAKRILREQGLNEKQMRGKIDMIAASLFLQTWLDRKNEEVQHA